MRISNVSFQNNIFGLGNFKMKLLDNIVILAGANGSGKSRTLKLISGYFEAVDKKEQGEILSKEEEAIASSVLVDTNDDSECSPVEKTGDKKLILVNYSHFDTHLQLPDVFPPYVISMAKENLKKCGFEGVS